ncbi:MAG TPA: hypothetical protein VK011_04595 [Acidimicrobiia bacterium]|nr:hypothetical protein [Acidimicrobiia bacterium]
MTARAGSRIRLLPVALAAGAALVVASWAGLVRLGIRLGSAPVAIHGPLMILGFLGTVISLERAVGLGRAWAWSAPIVSAVAVVMLLLGATETGLVLLLVAGLLLSVVYGAALTVGRWPAYLVVESLGAIAWLIAVGALLASSLVARAVPAMASFLVLTIVGERLELSRMGPDNTPGRRRAVVVASAAVLMTAAVAAWFPQLGARIAGACLVVLAAASAAGDIARRTVRRGGVTAYMAVAILSGYVWLALAGVLWIGGGLTPGSSLYDPSIHSLFIGFVLSMILAHAPVIVPAVAAIQLPFRRSWWAALVLLHLTLAARVAGALVGSGPLKTWGGVGNVAALALFIVLAAASGASTAKEARR